MNKKYIYLLILASTLFSCGNKDQKEKGKADKASLPAVITQVVGIGKVEPENDIIQLSSPVNGIVQNILKKENDTVSAGMPIVELDHQLEDAKVRQLADEVATQASQILADKAAVKEFEAKYNNALAEVQRLQRLYEKGAETKQALDNASADMWAFNSNFEKLRANVEVSNNRWKQTKAALQVAEVERQQKIIKSPVDGKLLEIGTLVGSSIDTRQAFAQISPKGKTIAVCEVDELYADKVSVGQTAWIRNVGSLDTLSTATVYMAFSFLKKKSLFTDQAGEKEDRRVRTIKIMLDQPEKLLLNARVECVIDISGNPKK